MAHRQATDTSLYIAIYSARKMSRSNLLGEEAKVIQYAETSARKVARSSILEEVENLFKVFEAGGILTKKMVTAATL